MENVTEEVAKQLLTFRLAEESYGVDILRVKEIRGWAPVTAIPEAPHFILGMLNLRGAIVPVIDMRSRFGLAPATPTPVTVIIVLSTTRNDGSAREFGVVVDSVSEVVQLDAAKQIPDRLGSECLSGLMEHQDELVKVLDVKQVMNGH